MNKQIAIFTSTFCSPCKRLKESINSLLLKYEKITFITYDIEEYFELVQSYYITSVPTLLFYYEDEVIKVEGNIPQVLLEEYLEKFSNNEKIKSIS